MRKEQAILGLCALIMIPSVRAHSGLYGPCTTGIEYKSANPIEHTTHVEHVDDCDDVCTSNSGTYFTYEIYQGVCTYWTDAYTGGEPTAVLQHAISGIVDCTDHSRFKSESINSLETQDVIPANLGENSFFVYVKCRQVGVCGNFVLGAAPASGNVLSYNVYIDDSSAAVDTGNIGVGGTYSTTTQTDIMSNEIVVEIIFQSPNGGTFDIPLIENGAVYIAAKVGVSGTRGTDLFETIP